MTKQSWTWTGIGLIAAILILIVLVPNIRTNKNSNSSPLVIGAALALTGDAATWGEASRDGAQLAVDEINANGGINGRSLELKVEDIRSTAEGSVLAISKLQDIDGARALLSSWLDIYQGAESALREDSYLISPDAGIEAVNGTTLHQRVYSTWYRVQPKSDLAVSHMAKANKKKLYLVAQKDPYYESVEKFMKEAAAKYGVEIVGSELITPDTDMKALLPKIAGANPDAIFFAFYDEKLTTEFLKRRSDLLDKNIAIYGDEFVQQNYNRSDYNSEWFEGIYYYSPRKPDTKFYENYKARYGKDPVFGASTTYDAVYMIAKAMKDKPSDMDAYMRKTTFSTVSYGNVTIDAIGGIQAAENYFTINQIRQGKPVDSGQ